MKKIKAAVIQFDVKLGDVGWNLGVVKQRINALAKKGVRLVLLPEMWSTGFANRRLNKLSETTPGIVKYLSVAAEKHNLMIIGSSPEKRGDGIYNTAYVLDCDGSIAGTYQKVHLFSPTAENRYFMPGRKAVVLKTTFGLIGLMICYDLRFPELCRSLVLGGAKIVAVMAQWPAARVGHWDVLLKARAIENQVFVLGANRCGKDGDLAYAGHSRIITPYGEVIARAGKRPATLLADIDLRVVEKTRKHIPCLEERVPDVYEGKNF